jgi:hypothetical protein
VSARHVLPALPRAIRSDNGALSPNEFYARCLAVTGRGESIYAMPAVAVRVRVKAQDASWNTERQPRPSSARPRPSGKSRCSANGDPDRDLYPYCHDLSRLAQRPYAAFVVLVGAAFAAVVDPEDVASAVAVARAAYVSAAAVAEPEDVASAVAVAWAAYVSAAVVAQEWVVSAAAVAEAGDAAFAVAVVPGRAATAVAVVSGRAATAAVAAQAAHRSAAVVAQERVVPAAAVVESADAASAAAAAPEGAAFVAVANIVVIPVHVAGNGPQWSGWNSAALARVDSGLRNTCPGKLATVREAAPTGDPIDPSRAGVCSSRCPSARPIAAVSRPASRGNKREAGGSSAPECAARTRGHSKGPSSSTVRCTSRSRTSCRLTAPSTVRRSRSN